MKLISVMDMQLVSGCGTYGSSLLKTEGTVKHTYFEELF